MNRIAKTVVSLFVLVVVVASSTTNVRAQTLRGIPVNMDRTDVQGNQPHQSRRFAKKGAVLSAKGSMISTSKNSKKAALKLTKKSSRRPEGDSKPDTPRLKAPVPAPVIITTSPVPHDPKKDSKSSAVPSDEPSMVPTIGFDESPTVLPINGDDDNSDGGVTTLPTDFPTGPVPSQVPTVDDFKSSYVPSDGPSLVPTSMLGDETPTDLPTDEDDDDNSDGNETARPTDFPTTTVPTQILESTDLPSDGPSLVPTSMVVEKTPTVLPTNGNDDSDEKVTALPSDLPTAPVPNQDIESSDIPSDGPSLVPSTMIGDETPTDFLTNDDHDGRTTEGPFEMSPAERRKLALRIYTPDDSPTAAPCLESTNVPTTAGSSAAPSTTDSSSMPTEVKCVDGIIVYPEDASNGFGVPPAPIVIFVVLAYATIVLAHFWQYRFRDVTSNTEITSVQTTPRAQNPRVQPLEPEGTLAEGQEGQFVNH